MSMTEIEELNTTISSLKSRKKTLEARKKAVDNARKKLDAAYDSTKGIKNTLGNFIDDLSAGISGSAGIKTITADVSLQEPTVYGFQASTDEDNVNSESSRLARAITDLQSQINTAKYRLQNAELEQEEKEQL